MKLSIKYQVLLARRDAVLQEFIDRQIEHFLWTSGYNNCHKYNSDYFTAYFKYISTYLDTRNFLPYDYHFLVGWGYLQLWRRIPETFYLENSICYYLEMSAKVFIEKYKLT